MIHLQPLGLVLGNSSLLLPYLCSSRNASQLAQWSSLTQGTNSQTYTLPSQVSPQITAHRTQSVHNKTSKQWQQHKSSSPIHEMATIHLHHRTFKQVQLHGSQTWLTISSLPCRTLKPTDSLLFLFLYYMVPKYAVSSVYFLSVTFI